MLHTILISIVIVLMVIVLIVDVIKFKNIQLVISKYWPSIDTASRQHQTLALRQLALGLSHELKNPITSMKTLLQVAKKRDDPVSYEQFNHILNYEIDRLNHIIAEFLNYTDIGHLYLKRQDLALLAAEAIKNVKKITEIDRIELINELKEALWASVDKNKIITVFTALIKNALEAMPDYGGQIVIKSKKGRRYYDISILDNGKGIREQDVEKIFLPFFSTRHKQLGLGLAVSQAILHRHGGDIFYEKLDDGRTCFRLRILKQPSEKFWRR